METNEEALSFLPLFGVNFLLGFTLSLGKGVGGGGYFEYGSSDPFYIVTYLLYKMGH